MRLFERIATWFEDWTLPDRLGIGNHGTDINPATGLPTIAGAGSPDVAGNPYGSTRSHDYESDWQRHDRWDHGSHDHFQHHGATTRKCDQRTPSVNDRRTRSRVMQRATMWVCVAA